VEGKLGESVRTFVAVIFVAGVGVLACHACVGARVGRVACVGVRVWVGGALVRALVLLVHEAGSLFLEHIEIHDAGCFDGSVNTLYRLVKAVEERMSWHL
jgi:hypothetical protein